MERGAIPVEARSHRLYPGEGSLPLLDLLDALPPGVPLSLEAPASHVAHLSTLQRVHAIARCTRTLLQAHALNRSATEL